MLVYLLHNKVLCHNAESPRLFKMKAFIQTATRFYCLFWFESLVWWVNEGLWVQLSVVMRPLPHSFTLGHNKSATPAFGFLASPAIGSWRKLGALLPLHWRACHFGITEHKPHQRERGKNSSCSLPDQPPTFCYHPTKPSSPLGPRDCRFALMERGLGHRDAESIIVSGLLGIEVT